jgi:hypothetical protein
MESKEKSYNLLNTSFEMECNKLLENAGFTAGESKILEALLINGS